MLCGLPLQPIVKLLSLSNTFTENALFTLTEFLQQLNLEVGVNLFGNLPQIYLTFATNNLACLRILLSH